jgi:hypothetical protein
MAIVEPRHADDVLCCDLLTNDRFESRTSTLLSM